MSGFRDCFNYHIRIIYGLITIIFLIYLFEDERRQTKDYDCYEMDQKIDNIYWKMERFNFNAVKDLDNKIMPSCFKGRK